MKQTAWLVQRAALAVLLMVSFYALALGIAGALLWIPYEAYVNDVRLPIKIALICVALAGTIIWAVLPRIDRFVPPGPPLSAVDSPQLFEVLNSVASSTQQTMPAHVYLVNDVNAFVTQRGGVMGFGSRRVMGVGLPLMQALTVQEFKAVLAHEFGHYHAGDVSIGPWIYKTRAAIGRTIHQLGEGYLQKIFIAYGNLFLRVTHAVSRRQEFIADEVAARAAGAAVMASALRKVHGAAVAFHNYWRGEVSPVLNSGYLPPLAAGFERFVHVESVSSNMATAIQTEEAEGQSDPYDTHPPLRERVAALKSLPQGHWGDTRAAVSLLGDPQRWERRLLATGINEDWARSLKPVGWDKVVDTVYVPMWRQGVKEHAGIVSAMTLTRLPFVGRFTPTGGVLGESEETAVNQLHVVNMALSLALLESGWTVSTSPGEEIVFRRDGREMRPFAELMGVAMGKVTPEQWAARCVELGIDAVALGGAVRV
jgi:Zn-dependent protease with chaperone function